MATEEWVPDTDRVVHLVLPAGDSLRTQDMDNLNPELSEKRKTNLCFELETLVVLEKAEEQLGHGTIVG